MSRRTKKTPQYKLWVHIEEWVDGEPVDGDATIPECIIIPGGDGDNLVGSFAQAHEIEQYVIYALQRLADERRKLDNECYRVLGGR